MRILINILLVLLIPISHINSQDFKASINQTSFRLVDKEPIKNMQKFLETGELDNRYNQWYFDLDIDLINLSNQLIENAWLILEIDPAFNNESVSIRPRPQKFLKNRWKNNQKVNVNTSFRLELDPEFKKEIMEHNPSVVYLSIRIAAKNSVGYENNGEYVIMALEIPNW